MPKKITKKADKNKKNLILAKSHQTESSASSNQIEETIMSQVELGEIKMKPRWYFWLGSGAMMASLIGLMVTAIFLLNILLFSLRSHGPMSAWRLEAMFNSFPWWASILALLSLVGSLWLLKKYDFSYRKNFFGIVVVVLIAVFLAAGLIQATGINESWSRQGPMRRFYKSNFEDNNLQRPRWGQGNQGQNRGYRLQQIEK